MSEPKFTPGPWEIWHAVEVYAASEPIAKSVFIADCDPLARIPEGQAEANARLITKAPEMYKLLDSILRADDLQELRDLAIRGQELLKQIDGE
jgi:hypothetical protein